MPHFIITLPATLLSVHLLDINSEYDEFVGDSVTLKHKLSHQGYLAILLNKGIHNFLANNSYKICTKYWICLEMKRASHNLSLVRICWVNSYSQDVVMPPPR